MSEIRGFSGVSSVGGAQIGQSGGVKLRVGQKIEGMVTSLSEEGIAVISASGKTITAQAAKGSLFVGEHIMLEITEIKGEAVLASRVNASESAILARLGMNLSEESLALVSELLKNNQLIDKDILSKLQTNSKEARLFLQHLESAGADVDIDIDIPIRSQLIKLIANSSQNAAGSAKPAVSAMPQPVQSASAPPVSVYPAPPPNVQPASGSSANIAILHADAAPLAPLETGASSPVSQAADSSVLTQSAKLSDARAASAEINPSETDGVGSAAVARKDAAAVLLEPSGKTLETAKPQGASVATDASDASGAGAGFRGADDVTKVVQAAKVLLSTFGAKENIALVSNDRALTLRNIAAANIDPADLADELISAAKSAAPDKKSTEALVEFAKGGKDAEAALKSVGSERLQAYLESSRIVAKQENPKIYYIPIPVKIEGEEARADVYCRRKPLKGSDLSVLVALKTHSIGEVRCIVNKYQSSYVLGFALESDEAAAAVREGVQALRRELKNLPVSDIFIRTRKEVDEEFFAASDRRSDFDVRI